MSDRLELGGRVEILCHLGIQHPENHAVLPNSFAAQGLSSSDIVMVVGSLTNQATGTVNTELEPLAGNNGLWIISCREVTPASDAEMVLTVKGYKNSGGTQLGSTETRSFTLASKKTNDKDRLASSPNINYPTPNQTVATTFAAYGTYNAFSAKLDPLGICTVGTSVTPDFFHVNPGADGFWIAAFKGLQAGKTYTLTVSFGGSTNEVSFKT